MSSNKQARKQLEKIYGKQCFIEKLHLRKDTEPRKYTSKGQMRRMKQLTYHHILERRNGGKSTVENGALLSNENHIWFNQQSKEKQEEMNQIFKDYKHLIDECKVVFVDDLEMPYTITAKEFAIDEKSKGNYNRAREKQELRKLSEEYIDR